MTNGDSVDRKAARELRSQVMWGYVTGVITLLCYVVGLERTFIPLGFGVLGLILAWQLHAKGERQHAIFAAALNVAGIILWLATNWAWLRGLAG